MAGAAYARHTCRLPSPTPVAGIDGVAGTPEPGTNQEAKGRATTTAVIFTSPCPMVTALPGSV